MISAFHVQKYHMYVLEEISLNSQVLLINDQFIFFSLEPKHNIILGLPHS